MMKQAPPALRALIRRLLTHEGSGKESAGGGAAVDCVCQKLGRRLVQILGELGFEALLARALALAKMEWPALGETQLITGQGLETLCKHLQGPDPKSTSEGQELILANLLWLLTLFIGEDLTLRVVQEAWPELIFDDIGGS